MLSTSQRRSFREYGFLTIPGFFTNDEINGVADAYERVWRELPPEVVVDSEATGRRVRIKDLTPAERTQSFKINDLYLRDRWMRDAVMSARLGKILQELIEDEPVVVNTLSVEYGTQQADHLDTLFMTPRTPGKLIATWMALEDVDADAGPLRYYPESNHIEPYRFADGGYHVRPDEMEQWSDYMAGQVDRAGLADTRFLARRGDLFIWDAWLLHGGSEICTPGLTRRSLITHYFTRTDCTALGSRLLPAEGGAWMKRPTQPVPNETPEEQNRYVELAEVSALASTRTPALRQARDLRDRLEELDPEHH